MKLTKQQQEARIAILRAVHDLGGSARWSQLHRRGHHYMQVGAAALRGDLKTVQAYHYELTDAGRAALKEKAGEEEER